MVFRLPVTEQTKTQRHSVLHPPGWQRFWQGPKKRSFGKDRKGSAIVEFAMVAAPLIMLIGGIVELSVLMLASNALQGAVQIAGQQMASGDTAVQAQAFRQAVCDRLPAMMSCDSNLIIDVRSVADWSSVENNAMPVEQFLASGSDDMLVRVSYRWPIIFPFAVLGLDVSQEEGDFVMAATAVMQ